MKRLINQHPGRMGRVLLGLLPFVMLIIVYVFASQARLEANAADKLLPSFSKMADSMMTMAFEPSKRSGELLLWADTFARLNLALFFFNMLPVHPLDGGKLFFLGLLRLTSPLNALKAAGAVGVVFSILWWPALIWVYVNYGWLLLFAPSLRQHLAMMRGEITG